MGICILAAVADGSHDEVERAQIQRMVEGFTESQQDLAAAYQDTLGGRYSLRDLAAQLPSPAARTLAYDMAVCVCHAHGELNDGEKRFLQNLREALQLDAVAVEPLRESAQTLAAQPLATPVPPVLEGPNEAEIDKTILNASILNGALELMPQTLATMAIVPLQMRMVYRIGRLHGYELDRGHIKDFLATVGVGMTSQVVESFARQLLGGFTRKFAGRLVGGLASQATGSAFSFATTYALGQVAKRYYAGGRTLSTEQLKETFSSMFNEAQGLQSKYAGAIADQSRRVNLSQLISLAKQ